MNDVLNDKAWLEQIMYVIRINQWENRFRTSNLFFSTSRMLTFYTAGKVHKQITTECSAYGKRVTEGTPLRI